jgi:hypothetical protein
MFFAHSLKIAKLMGYHGALVSNQSEWSYVPQVRARTNGSKQNKGQSQYYKNLYGYLNFSSPT